MADRKTHCDDCVAELGEPFEKVHDWLDELFSMLGPKHRSARHHTGGVAKVREMWGDRAARAAEIHIKRDCIGHIPSPSEAQVWSMFGQVIVPKKDGGGGFSD